MESSTRARAARLLVLGAGPAQLGLLEAARARGLLVAVVDRDTAAPGFRLADRRCILSTEDEPAIERLVAALEIDGIVSPGTDWPVGVAARIAERAGLSHPITPATAVLATNKLRQRERLAEAGVPQPRWWVVGNDDPPPQVAGRVVVKAPDRQGQKGLSLVEQAGELPAAIERARSAARSGAALVEELVDGPEVTVIGFSVDGAFTALAVTDRVVAEPPAFGVALAHVWPSRAVSHISKVSEAVSRALAALGVQSGPSYTQLRIGPDGPRVIEVAARLGGGHDAELVETVTGVDLNGLAIDAALGNKLLLSRREVRVGGAVTRFLVAPPGVLEHVDVPDDLPGVAVVRIYREPGHVFAPLRRGSDRAGAVLAAGGSREEALARADAAADRIRFVTADAGRLSEAI
ncbi:MAG TPA: ATP-grasp domain-containing protein [Gaiellaceae bacterium]|nr:ATP-grasp domain-containing protein [Gaiellaceae bacterium]